MDIKSFIAEKIKWLGHASFRIDGSQSTVYIDPWKLTSDKTADLVCITHSHFDHLSEQDVSKITGPSTVVVGPPDCKAGFGDRFKAIAPGEKLEAAGVVVEAVPAYNTNKDFHPKKNNWVGYILTVDGIRIYHTGDSDVIPEMADVNADVALVPVGGTYTMTVSEAADAVKKINPKFAVPMHCGDIVGSFDDRKSFEKASTSPVYILDPIK